MSTSKEYNPPLPLPPKTHTCWFSAITDRTKNHFIYAVSFREQYPYSGLVRVPLKGVTEGMVKIWEEHSPPGSHEEVVKVNIERNEKTRGVAEFGDLVREEKEVGVRKLKIHFDERIFEGEVTLPIKEVKEEIKIAKEEQNALPTTEPEPPSPLERRTVVFTKAPVKGRLAEVEVWSVDGLSSLTMIGTVTGVERKERRYVTIVARVPETGQWVDLRGDLDLDARHKVMRCVEVGERRGYK